MGSKTVTPALGENSFTCPHCGAIAHQSWYKIFMVGYGKDDRPHMPDNVVIENIKNDRRLENKDYIINFLSKMTARKIFIEQNENGVYVSKELINLYASQCYSCNEYSLWVADRLIYPPYLTEIQANEDLPDAIKVDFQEAVSIVDCSARGAAALLRLCVQKLMLHLGLKGKNLDEDIAELVKRGLDRRVQKALDVVRVIGNNAVHPGQIDLQDDKATALKLFDLVNLIVDAMVSTPKHIAAMYDALPEGALAAIEKRDRPKGE